jgi:hypothetical protein
MSTDVREGGELPLEPDPTLSSFSQERVPAMNSRREKRRATFLTDEHRPRVSSLLNERIEAFLFFIDPVWKKIDGFGHDSMLRFLVYAFNVDPVLGLESLKGGGGSFGVIDDCLVIPDTEFFVDNHRMFL